MRGKGLYVGDLDLVLKEFGVGEVIDMKAFIKYLKRPTNIETSK